MIKIIVLLLSCQLAFAESSLHFANAGDFLNCGSQSAVDNLWDGNNQFSITAWVYRDQDTFTLPIVSKGDGGNNGWVFMSEIDSATFTQPGALRLIMRRVDGVVSYVSVANMVKLNEWTFVAATFDSSLGNYVDLYTGDRDTMATEVAYDEQGNSSGNFNDDSAIDLRIGNTSSETINFDGNIANVQIFKKRLSLAEIHEQQFRSMPISGGTNAQFVVNLGFTGTGTQYDLSGNGSNCAVTGATAVVVGAPVFISGGPI